MLKFETLLLRQLQKQQSRDEFCDTVLHTQGVTVPVHSCVLTAFSPRLFGTLSSMPVPMAGHRRLIELQAMDAYTLLNLVSLLYSGQLPENSEQVLSAAQSLGIELPEWQEEERHGGKEGRGKEVDAREWDDGVTRRMEESSDTWRESGTQTECWRETGAQTDLVCLEPQNNQTVYLIDQPTNQELGSYTDVRDTALALQAVHLEGRSTSWNMSGMAPVTGYHHTVSESPCVSQVLLYSLETSHNPPSTSSVNPHGHNCCLDQSTVVSAAVADNKTDLRQFEGNIPGFINYFLESTDTQNVGARGQGCSKEGAKEGKVVKSARARPTGEGSVKELVRGKEGGRGRRRKKNMERWGLVAGLAWHGQGGGRVGRLLESRSKGKKSMMGIQRWQGREAQVETRKARGRGRTGTRAGSKGQNDPPRRGRTRGRPRIRPLPPSSRSFSTMTTTEQVTVDLSELDLLHTGTPTSAAQMESVQLVDSIVSDIMTGLQVLPPTENPTNHHGLISTTTFSGAPIDAYPNSDSVKAAEPKQHLEGELNDILDHFLRTFDQHVGSCGLDVGNEILQDNCEAGDDQSDPSLDRQRNTPKTYAQLLSYNPHLHHQKPQANFLHSSSTLSTQPQITSSANPALAFQYGQIPGGVEKPSRDQSIAQQSENRRLTRSQSMKRKLEMALSSLRNSEKKKCREKQSTDTVKKRERDNMGRSVALANKLELNNLAESNRKKTKQAHRKDKQKQASSRECKHGRKKRGGTRRSQQIDVLYESKKKNPQEGRLGISVCGKKKMSVGEDCATLKRTSSGFQACQPSVNSQIRGTCVKVASLAMKKMKMLIRLQDHEEDEGANDTVGLHREDGRVVNHKSISGAGERLHVRKQLRFGHLGRVQESEDEGGEGIVVNREVEGQETTNGSRMGEMSQRQHDDERLPAGPSQEEVMTEQCSLAVLMNQPSNAVFSAKEGNCDDKATPSTTESPTKALDSCPDDLFSALGVRLFQSEVVQPSTQNTMHKMADLILGIGGAPQFTSAAEFLQARPFREHLSPHTSTKDIPQLGESSLDEEDVDVLEGSSPTSALPAVPPVILQVDPSSEEEEEDDEIDVLGLELV